MDHCEEHGATWCVSELPFVFSCLKSGATLQDSMTVGSSPLLNLPQKHIRIDRIPAISADQEKINLFGLKMFFKFKRGHAFNNRTSKKFCDLKRRIWWIDFSDSRDMPQYADTFAIVPSVWESVVVVVVVAKRLLHWVASGEVWFCAFKSIHGVYREIDRGWLKFYFITTFIYTYLYIYIFFPRTIHITILCYIYLHLHTQYMYISYVC